MTAGEAKRIAQEWANARFPNWPHAIGAILAGPLAFLPDDAAWPEAALVEIWVFERAELSPPRPRFHHAGIAMSVESRSFHELGPADGVLSDPHRAASVARRHIIYRPEGLLALFCERAVAEFANPRSVAARMDRAERDARYWFGKLKAMPAGSHLHLPLQAFVRGLREAAAIPASAALDRPTFRHLFARQRDHLARHGLADVHERSLAVVGPEALSRAEASMMLDTLPPLFRVARSALRESSWPSSSLDPAAEAYAVETIGAMIDAGEAREAALAVLDVHAASYFPVMVGGRNPEKDAARELLACALATVGVRSLVDLQDRGRHAVDLLPTLRAAGDEIARSRPIGDE